MSEISSKPFRNLNERTLVQVDSPTICCAITAHTEAQCETDTAEKYDTCEQLLPESYVKIPIWIFGISALLSNLFVFVWGCMQLFCTIKSVRQVLLIINLAASDLLMGVYLLIIATADQHYGEYFPPNADDWRTSHMCKVAGFLSVLSSEASLMFIAIISFERFWAVVGISYKRVTKFKSKYHKLFPSNRAVVLAVWLLAILFSVLSIIMPSAVTNVDLYNASNLCIGLPLTRSFTYKNMVENITVAYQNIYKPSDMVTLESKKNHR